MSYLNIYFNLFSFTPLHRLYTNKKFGVKGKTFTGIEFYNILYTFTPYYIYS